VFTWIPMGRPTRRALQPDPAPPGGNRR
jgi:hypothetical protein